jgi:two-component system chemotaxis response regulator CheB
VGHAWTSEALLASQAETLDAALWTALRALEESASLSQQLSERARARGNTRVAERLSDNATLAMRRADIIRDVLLSEREIEPRDEGEMVTAKRSGPLLAPRQREGISGHD